MKAFVLAALLGAATVSAFAPFALPWLPLLTLAGLLQLWHGAPDARCAAGIGGAFGLGLFGGGVSWVYVSLQQFGGMAPALAGLATALFCAYLAAFPAGVGAAYWRFRRGEALADAMLVAGLWTASEWLRGTLFTGFPWLALGYSQATDASPLAGMAPVLGVYGVSFLTVLIPALGFGAWRRGQQGRCSATGHSRWAHAAVPVVVALLLVALAGALRQVTWTQPAGAPISVALLQGNVAQDMKWRPERFAESLRTYHDLMRTHPATLTVLPETALPAFYEAIPPGFLEALAGLARDAGGDVLVGAVTGSGEVYRNSVVSLGRAPSSRYDKQHLVPFGEFVPPGFVWFMRQMDIPMSGFTPGRASQAPLPVAGQQVAANICYEDVFGEALIGAIRDGGATVLVNLSNTAWFGRSWAQPQHLQIARMRSLETGRPMLRATNTGMTAVIAADGLVSAVLPPFTRGALRAEVQATTGLTPYVRFGNGPALLLAGLGLLPALRWRGKSR